MLLSKERSRGGPGVRRSLALLIGRLLICLLFLFVGWTQVPTSRQSTCDFAAQQAAVIPFVVFVKPLVVGALSAGQGGVIRC